MFSTKEIKEVMQRKGYLFFSEGLYNLNIIGIRNLGKVDAFDDELHVIYKNGIGEEEDKVFQFTSEPGLITLEKPINPNGTAILVPGQYIKMWKIGLHKGLYEALIQINPVKVYRDNDLDKEYDLDPATIQEGCFGINLHHGAMDDRDKVGAYSAGCQVVKAIRDYCTIRSVWRSSKAIWGDEFSYTLLENTDFKR